MSFNSITTQPKAIQRPKKSVVIVLFIIMLGVGILGTGSALRATFQHKYKGIVLDGRVDNTQAYHPVVYTVQLPNGQRVDVSSDCYYGKYITPCTSSDITTSPGTNVVLSLSGGTYYFVDNVSTGVEYFWGAFGFILAIPSGFAAFRKRNSVDNLR